MLTFIRNALRRKRPVPREDDPLRLLARLTPGDIDLDTLVHVGAHLAQERRQYEAHGFREILWIEGSPATYRRLRGVLADHAIARRSRRAPARHRAVCALLTDRAGDEVDFREFSNDGMSSSVFGATAASKARWPGLHETGRRERLRTQTLDRVLADQGFTHHVDVLVLDTQGAELLVLKGAEDTLPTVKAVISEVSTVPYYDGGVLFPELKSFLNEQGFREIGQPPSHGDVLFLNRALQERKSDGFNAR